MDTIYSGLYIEDDHLYDFAVSTARLLSVTGYCRGSDGARVLRQSYTDIQRCHSAIERRYGDMASPPAACEWLLDNWYMVRREYLSSYFDLRQSGRLRACADGSLIEALSGALIQSGHGAVTEERCKIFLDGFQSVTVLCRRELGLFPVALRSAIISGIARIREIATHSRM